MNVMELMWFSFRYCSGICVLCWSAHSWICVLAYWAVERKGKGRDVNAFDGRPLLVDHYRVHVLAWQWRWCADELGGDEMIMVYTTTSTTTTTKYYY